MDINTENFWERVPDLLLIIAAADYIAIDFEMTGIQVKDSLSSQALTLNQVYNRIADAASTFQTIQLGLTAIQWKEGSILHVKRSRSSVDLDRSLPFPHLRHPDHSNVRQHHQGGATDG